MFCDIMYVMAVGGNLVLPGMLEANRQLAHYLAPALASGGISINSNLW
jgi:hypothetical protein